MPLASIVAQIRAELTHPFPVTTNTKCDAVVLACGVAAITALNQS